MQEVRRRALEDLTKENLVEIVLRLQEQLKAQIEAGAFAREEGEMMARAAIRPESLGGAEPAVISKEGER